MNDAVASSMGIVAYLALFGAAGVAFVFVSLLVGRFVRPVNPHPEKLEIYECGEPAIGTSFVQFDLRFYVVALVFIIFDVEVAFLFPWGTVFGKATGLLDQRVAVVAGAGLEGDQPVQLTEAAAGTLRELGVRQPQPPEDLSAAQVQAEVRQAARQLIQISAGAIAVFFVVLLVGLAYEWRSGALDWVRAVSHARPITPIERPERPSAAVHESVLSA